MITVVENDPDTCWIEREASAVLKRNIGRRDGGVDLVDRRVGDQIARIDGVGESAGATGEGDDDTVTIICVEITRFDMQSGQKGRI